MAKNQSMIKHLFLTAWIQILVLVCLLFRTIVLPKFLSIESYALFQTYLLFIPYLTFFSFGFNDGFNLRFAKHKRSFFRRKDTLSPLIVFITMTLAELVLYFLAITTVFKSFNIVMFFVGINIPVLLTYNFFIYYLQITMRIKKYNFFVLIEKLSFVVLVLVLLLTKNLTLFSVLLLDVATSFIFIGLAFLATKKEILTHNFSLLFGSVGYIKNVMVGWKLMIGSYLGIIFFTFPRLIAQQNFNIREFSYFSFAFSVVSIIYALINSVSMIIFPFLAKKDEENQKNTFIVMSDIYHLMLPILFISYYPAMIFITVVLPEYRSSIAYFTLVFLMIILNTKISMVINNYYKALRKEHIMFYDNLLTVVSMVAIMFIVKNPTLLFIIYIGLLVLKVIAATIYLQLQVQFNNYTNLITEFGIILCFVVSINLKEPLKFGAVTLVVLLSVFMNFSKYKKYASRFLKR